MLLLLLFVVGITLVLYYVNYIFTYWRRLGFPFVRPVVPLGSLGPVLRKKKAMGELVRDLHLLKRKEPVIGLYFLNRPVLLVRELPLIKRILVTDFDHFTDRGTIYDEQNDPIAAHLFSMPGRAWKTLRAKLSPTFSSAKLKSMFTVVSEKAQDLTTHLDECIANDVEDVQMKSVLVKQNMNIIATVFFGFELNVFDDPHHPFARIGEIFLDTTRFRENFTMFCGFLYPKLLKTLKIPVLSREVAGYVRHIFQSVLEARKNDSSLKRNDFIQTILELMEKEKDADHSESEPDASGATTRLSPDKCAAQAFVFYLGGYETSASTTSFTLWELARNPLWMAKAREEVDELMKKRNGKLQYEDLGELKVLDKCIREGMRKYPIVPFLNRECTKEYEIVELNLTIPKGTGVLVSTLGLNMDPELNPDPEAFEPSRYEEGSNDEPWSYGFGLGPRYCIGGRLGLIMVRMALATLIHKYNWEAVDDKIVLNAHGFPLCDRHNVRLRASPRVLSEK